MRIIGIAWAKSSQRLNDIVGEIGGSVILISCMSEIKIFAPIRYAILTIRTLLLAIRSKPDVIIAQNPPIFCPLSACIYALLFRKKFIIAHHSLSIVRKGILWKVLATIEFLCMRLALTNTVIHEGYERLCRKIGISSLTLLDTIPEIPRNYLKFSKFTAIAPLGGHPDEDVETLIELTKIMKNENMRILVTGKVEKDLFKSIEYVGFLPSDKYFKTISMAHIGLCLIKDNEWTLPHVIFEFIGGEIPFLVTKTSATMIFGDPFLVKSKEELLRKLFFSIIKIFIMNIFFC